MKITEKVKELEDEVIRLRRDFHKHPELGFEEERTAKIVAEYLEECGLEVETGIAKTGVVGLLEGKEDGPTVLLRADIEEGILEDPKVDAAFGAHLWTPIESGKLGITSGPVMGALDEFKLTVKGKGGHTSAPEEAIDPILTASDIIQTTQMIQTREINALKSTVIMFGRIDGGTTTNVIPEEVELEGTIRYLYQGGEDSEERPKERFERIVQKVCETHRAEYELEFIPSNSVVYNEPEMTDLVKSIAEEKVVEESEDIISYTALGGEDFSEFLAEVPGVFYFIGTGNPAKGTDYPHHHPHFNIDEDTLTTGVELHVRSALTYLNNF